MSEFSKSSTQAFARPDSWDITVPAASHGGQHNEILQNFVDAILHNATLLAPAVEGIHSVELANAMLMSAWTDEAVTLPIDGKKYERLLKQKIAESARTKKKARKVVAGNEDFAKSFGR
jgi:hypothetical protein